MPPSDLKVCRPCGQSKPLGMYHRDRTKRDGVSTVCKSCRIARIAMWRTAHPDYGKQRWESGRRPRRIMAHVRARRKLQRAIVRG